MPAMDNDSLVSGLQLLNRIVPFQNRGTGSDLLYVSPAGPNMLRVKEWEAHPDNLKPEDKKWLLTNGWHWDEENGWWGFNVF